MYMWVQVYELAGRYEGLTEEVARERAQARQIEQEVLFIMSS
jgi:hypothetical protein